MLAPEHHYHNSQPQRHRRRRRGCYHHGVRPEQIDHLGATGSKDLFRYELGASVRAALRAFRRHLAALAAPVMKASISAGLRGTKC